VTDFSGTVDESDTTVSAGGYTAKFFGPEGRKSEEILQKTEGGAPGAGSYTTNTALSGAAAYGYKASQPSARIGRKQPRRVRSAGIPFVTSA